MADLFHRVSIRKYEDREVEPDKIIQILKAAMAAPSAADQQPWEFYVVTDIELMQKLAVASPYAGPLKNAPAAIIAAYRRKCTFPDFAQIDMSIAMENMWLEADELGLGGVWLGIAPMKDRMEMVEQILSIPEDQSAFGIFAFGYPAEEKIQENRFDPSRVHYVTDTEEGSEE